MNQVTGRIREKLFSLKDDKYAEFQSKLIPAVPRTGFIGVRTPELRKLAKDLAKLPDTAQFLDDLPHETFDENNLHGMIISYLKDYDETIRRLDEFLPFVDNWAVCDQMSPAIFKKHKNALLSEIKRWQMSDREYTVRFGTGMLMAHYLDEDFSTEYIEWAAVANRDEYYVKMMTAWFFATALSKQYDSTVIWLEQRRLDTWTHNKAIQKAVESYRISDEKKQYLKTLRIKKN